MDNWKEELQQYLPTIEEFLASVLLEETSIEIVSFEGVDYEAALGEMKDTDIFLYTRDNEHLLDIIITLDQEWYGLLSSVMLGIEEKSKNETTIELLEEFSEDLSAALMEQLEANGFAPDLGDKRVFSLSEVEEELGHTEYFLAQMEIEGIADDPVRAELLLGNPEAQRKMEEPEPTQDEEETSEDEATEKEQSDEDFASLDAEEMGKIGSEEEVISARHIEFGEFGESSKGEAGKEHSMDLLKDVELDVSVELGRIELPLGKVLQLAKGSVIELEKLAGEPVDILVNGHHIAHGEVVVIDEHFGVRISNLITTRKRLAGLQNGT